MTTLEDQPFLAWLLSLVFPLILMGVTASYLIFTALCNPRLLLTFQIDKIRSQAFASVWALIGPIFADDFPSPYLDDLITTHCHGTVLDIGPGSGFQVKRFRSAFQRGQIESIWAVEPGEEMHDQLKTESIKTFGGEATTVYKILTSGAQPDQLIPTLAKNKMLDQNDGIFDTIVVLRALCGIPQPQETVSLFYRLLKPGGRIIFFEHVANTGNAQKGGNLIAKMLQQVYMFLGWSFWNGGCELTRDTAQILRNAARADGGWAFEEVFDRNPRGCVPEIYGYMQKRATS